MTVSDQSRAMFDEKIAVNPTYQYSENNTQAWMEMTRDYPFGKRWEMKNLMIWSEGFQRKVILESDVHQLVTQQAYMQHYTTHCCQSCTDAYVRAAAAAASDSAPPSTVAIADSAWIVPIKPSHGLKSYGRLHS